MAKSCGLSTIYPHLLCEIDKQQSTSLTELVHPGRQEERDSVSPMFKKRSKISENFWNVW